MTTEIEGRPPDDSSFDAAQRGRILRDGVINNTGPLATLVIGLALVPILLKGLGLELYGLWLAAMALCAALAGLDFGLGWAIVRVVAAAQDAGDRSRAADFVAHAGGAITLLGAITGTAIAVVGCALSDRLGVAHEVAADAPAVFVLAGLGFACDQMLNVSLKTLHGLRRFDLINLATIASSVLRAAGFVALLHKGGALVAIAAWSAVVSMLSAILASIIVAHLEPLYRLRHQFPRWDTLRPHVPFGLGSVAIGIVGNLIWQGPQLLIGIVRGSAWIAAYYVGQRFPLAALGIATRAAGVLFPVISGLEGRGNPALRRILEMGTRWLFMFALPLFIPLWIVAPVLLHAWLGEARPDTVAVFRITVVAVFADVVCGCAYQVLWARGAMRGLLVVLAGMLLVSLAGGYALLGIFGLQGLAWAFLAALAGGSVAFLLLACRESDIDPRQLISSGTRGLFIPSLGCAIAALCVQRYSPAGEWVGAGLAGLSAVVAYAGLLWIEDRLGYGRPDHLIRKP
jgi:O-antigen/teichoic acid export membrane protein